MRTFGNHLFFFVVFTFLFSAASYSQTEPDYTKVPQKQEPAYQSQTVLRSTTRLVVVDVVAIDDKGQPVTDLKQDDFTVMEDGKPQKISDFSFHHPAGNAAPAPEPAPGIISNAPQYSSNSCLNVILLDAINTDFSNHAYAQDMLVKYLDSNPAIQPTAIFAMEGKLIMLHDFTTDTKVLRDVLGHYKPQYVPKVADVYTAASPFQRRGSFQAGPHAREVTAKSMLFLAHALAGYPGRKNLLWLSDGFPINLFPEFTAGDQVMLVEDYSPLAEKIADELMNAQIALYPIDAAGVAMNDRFSARTAMLSMSERTGGKTFYNRNDIDTGIRTSLDDGATYYTMEYYPQNRNWDAKFRRIEVKLSRPGVHLRYRQGYYALVPITRTSGDTVSEAFSHAMDRDSPTSTGVRFQARVLPPSPQTQGKVVVNFGIDPRTVAFQKEADDLEHASISCVVWAYGSKGDPVRAEGSATAALKSEAYQQVMRSYYPCQRSLSLKPGHYTFRLGVLDETSSLIGTATTQVTIP